MTSLQGKLLQPVLRLALSGAGRNQSLADTRDTADRLAERWIRPVRGTKIKSIQLDQIQADWIEPVQLKSDRVLLYLHGGGYTLCSPATHRGLTSSLSRESCSQVLVPAYRLAPEHTFPAALQDGLTSYRWLLRQGTPACRIALVGDSAGGGLCLAVAVSLRMAGEPLPGALLLLSPWTDLTFSGESNRSRKAMDPIFGRNSLGAGFAPAYLGMDSPTNPLISPLFADLTGLPPTLIQVGTHEVLYDDATRLSASLKSCGVHADLQVWEGMWHVFQIFTPWVPESHQAVLSLGSFIRENIQ